MSNTLMMLSPYFIDVPLGVGGLLANHAEAGGRVLVVAACYPGCPPRAVYPEASPENPYGRFETRENYQRTVMDKEVGEAADILGIDEVITWDYEANRDALFGMDIVDKVTDALNEHQPDVVVAYWPVSNYTDFSGMTMAVMRTIIERRLEKMPQVYLAETLTGRHTLCFAPNAYVDITATIAKKKAACAAIWQGENIDYFFNPFSLPIAQFRGRECGASFAEAFVALHGGFGLEKRPQLPSEPGAHPVTMNRTVKCLDRKEFGEGIVPRTYGCIDQETAEKVYGV